MSLEERSHLLLLVARNGEDVAKASTGEDDLLASAFGLEDGAVRVHLRRTDRRYEGATRRERRIESSAICSLCTIFSQTNVSEAGDTKVSRRVQDGCSGETDLAVFCALTHS